MKILIVDDDKAILEAIKIILENNGHKVLTIERSAGIEELIKSEKPDLIFLDIKLNGESGWDIMKKLRSTIFSKSIPIIILSAKSGAEKEAIIKDADGFLGKPFEIKDLLNLVEKYKN